MGLANPRVCKLQNSSNPMFDANFIDAQHQAESREFHQTPNNVCVLHGGAHDPPRNISQAAAIAASKSTSPNISSSSICVYKLGGADRDRTGGLLVANQALSQLSYSPDRKVSRFQSFEGFKETP
jgi:hypothetical protein